MNILLMILLISLLVIVHEIGHFFAAKFFGMRVDKFGFGLPFGPTIFEKKIGNTTFVVHLFLFGGYVSFPDDDENSELPKDSPERFSNKPIYQRSIVVIAGVLANIVLAYLLVFFVAFSFSQLPSGKYEVKVSKIINVKNESLIKSGMKNGDIIYSINDTLVEYPYDINLYSQLSRKFDGFSPKSFLENRIEKLKELNGISDENKYLKKGEYIKLLEVDSEPKLILSEDVKRGLEVYRSSEYKLDEKQKCLRDEIYGKKVYKVEKDGQYRLKDIGYAQSDTYKNIYIRVKREVNRVYKIVELGPIISDTDGIIGIQKEVKEIYNRTDSINSAILNTNRYLIDNTKMMTKGLLKIFSGSIPLKDLHGVVVITKLGSDIIENQGIMKGLLLTAMISINLAIINILPFPALDGGHLLFLIIERIKGKPVDEKFLSIISNIGFMILLLLMFFVIFNDIYALITKKF